MRNIVVFGSLLLLSACTHASAAPANSASALLNDQPLLVASDEPRTAAASPANTKWFGAAAESERMLTGTEETNIGVWIEAPVKKDAVRPHVDVALVIDTSGSMEGAKIMNARGAARTILENLADGDIVSITTFSNEVTVLAAPQLVDEQSRPSLLRAVSGLRASGGTNMFDGLATAEGFAAQAPETHAVRRVILISDGMATVGPSSPEALGALAERALGSQTQITSLGVGAEYDEKTLDALAERSSGRFYHLSDPREMASIVEGEMNLLGQTVASDAFVEVVPAPGVMLVGTDGVHAEFVGTSLHLPLGALFGGQHREALVRVRVSTATLEDATASARPIASIRLHFRDPNDGGVERVQEIVARVQATNSASDVAKFSNARTRSIIAVQQASKWQLEAAQAVNNGHFEDAARQLAQAESTLAAQAKATNDVTERRRLEGAAHGISAQRAVAAAAPSASPAMRRDSALKMNAAGMHMNGL
jgi:Ca-activated chloride channel family protein